MKQQKQKRMRRWKEKGFALLYCIGVLALFLGFAFAKPMNLEVGDAKVIKFEGDVSEIFIANPDIADIQLSNPQTAYLYGKSPGATKFFAMNSKGEEILKADIYVSHNISQLKVLIAPFDPYDLVVVRSAPNAIILEGQADSPKSAEDIVAITNKFLGKSGKGETDQSVINRLVVKSPVQVGLSVKVAEVSRTVLNNFGINWQAAFSISHFNFGALTGRAPFTATPFATNNVLSITQDNNGDNAIGFNINNKHLNLNAAIDAMSKDGLITILAEPTLVAISGETASFLAGGEFPYPVPQAFGQVTVEFKQYGVSLAFTPTVLDGRIISMRVRPEVSELDTANSILILGQEVPAITTRRAETTIELASGQTFSIAGLLKNTNTSGINAIPGLGDLPVLGSLFRSNTFQNQESELVILVTPYLIEPVSGKEMPLPTDGMVYASFVEQILERRLLKEGPEKGQAPAFGPGGVRLVGPAGFSIE